METSTYLRLARSEYDVYSIRFLEAELDDLDNSAVIDFSLVRYFDSTSLGVLIRQLKKVRERDALAYFTLRNISPALRRVFEITGLTTIFTVES